MRSTTFRNIALGILALALAYHLGARTATAQAPGNPVVAMTSQSGSWAAVTANGDCYISGAPNGGTWTLGSNVFGGPTPARAESFGAVKSRYRGERGVQPAPQDR